MTWETKSVWGVLKTANMSCVLWWMQNTSNAHDMENHRMRVTWGAQEQYFAKHIPLPTIPYGLFTKVSRQRKQYIQNIAVNIYLVWMWRTLWVNTRCLLWVAYWVGHCTGVICEALDGANSCSIYLAELAWWQSFSWNSSMYCYHLWTEITAIAWLALMEEMLGTMSVLSIHECLVQSLGHNELILPLQCLHDYRLSQKGHWYWLCKSRRYLYSLGCTVCSARVDTKYKYLTQVRYIYIYIWHTNHERFICSYFVFQIYLFGAMPCMFDLGLVREIMWLARDR